MITPDSIHVDLEQEVEDAENTEHPHPHYHIVTSSSGSGGETKTVEDEKISNVVHLNVPFDEDALKDLGMGEESNLEGGAIPTESLVVVANGDEASSSSSSPSQGLRNVDRKEIIPRGPSQKKRFPHLLLLDLDGTLVHSEFTRRNYQQHDFSLFNEEIFVYKRPYLDYFLTTVLQWFEVGVWTASGCEYAAEIVRHIFPDPSQLTLLFSSERCTNKICKITGERIVIKDLKKVKRRGYPLQKVLIVDDTPSTWQRNYGNAVHIESYWGTRIDDHLLHLLTYLEHLGSEPDVRRIDKRRWRHQVLGVTISSHPTTEES